MFLAVDLTLYTVLSSLLAGLLMFKLITMKKKKKQRALAFCFYDSYSLSDETVTWVSCGRLVGREWERLIHPGSSIFGQE